MENIQKEWTHLICFHFIYTPCYLAQAASETTVLCLDSRYCNQTNHKNHQIDQINERCKINHQSSDRISALLNTHTHTHTHNHHDPLVIVSVPCVLVRGCLLAPPGKTEHPPSLPATAKLRAQATFFLNFIFRIFSLLIFSFSTLFLSKLVGSASSFVHVYFSAF